MRIEDITATYPDAGIGKDRVLRVAEAILRARMQRAGNIADPSEAADFFRMRLSHLPHEEFHVLFLDNRHRIVACELMFRGTIDGAEVHPRVIAQRALILNAAAVLLSHNHPSGDPTPSAADRAVTARLQQALALVDVRVLDHLVVAVEGVVSFASRGWL